MKKLPTLDDLSDVRGKRVLVRASLNAPVLHGKVTNTFRLAHALPTITELARKGAKVIVVGHIGREKDETLLPVYEELQKSLPLSWCAEVVGEKADAAVAKLGEGEVLLLENTRSHEGETENDASFAQALAAHGDVFVNDAFAASHRTHASIVGVAKLLPTYFGRNFMAEYEALTTARDPEHPALFVLGGAKFETKEPLITAFLNRYDTVFVGGALANDFFKARGLEVGTSVVGDHAVPEDIATHAHIVLPEKIVVANTNKDARTTTPDDVRADEAILDAFVPDGLIDDMRTILWNGPLGYYEGGYTDGTETCAKAVAAHGAHSVVGGGDTIASITRLNIAEQFSFVSTAGGAMLVFLETGTLPAIDVVVG